MRGRTTPSAGALYPFDVMIAFLDSARYELYHYHVVGACLRQLMPIREADLTNLVSPPDTVSGPPEAVVAIVGRPGRSMRKYGRRGYLYSCLDMAHAATNIALAAREAGFVSTVQLRFDRARAGVVLGLERPFLEVHSLITLHHSSDPTPLPRTAFNPFAVPIWRHDVDPAVEESDGDDREAWQMVRAVSGGDDQVRLPPQLGETLSVTADGQQRPAEVRLPRPPARQPFTFHQAALRRQSAKGFVAEPVDRDLLAHALSALTVPVQVDCATGPLVGMRLLSRRVRGLDGGVFTYAPEEHVLRPAGDGEFAADEIVAACMNQELVRDAAVLIALHAPVRPLLRAFGQQGLAELHFHAACAAQRLCLGAAEHGLGITCLGGFDAGLVATLMRLSGPQEVLYVLAAGVPDEFAVKWDRATVAFNHGISDIDDSGAAHAEVGGLT